MYGQWTVLLKSLLRSVGNTFIYQFVHHIAKMKLLILSILLLATQPIHCIAILNSNDKLSRLFEKKKHQHFVGLSMNKRQANSIESITMQPDVEWITVLPTTKSQKQREHGGLDILFDKIFAVIIIWIYSVFIFSRSRNQLALFIFFFSCFN